ncbi:hypothetical protein SISNIDRAFT_456105, partial [Sistotremastrum niveocremeum HHB9708]
MSGRSKCLCIGRQTRVHLDDLMKQPGNEWAEEYHSDSEEFEFQCEVWNYFFKLCMKSLKKDIGANVLDDFGLRVEADDATDCRGVEDDFLKDSHWQTSKLKEDMDALPWSYDTDYQARQTEQPKASWRPFSA